jgi:rhodanese-related sulfurtransferase
MHVWRQSKEEVRMKLTSDEMVAEARRRIENLDPAEVSVELAEGAILVDVREEDELRVQGWIPDSVWAPRGMLEFWADPASSHHRAEFDPGHRLILYCARGGRSALAADTLRRMGYLAVAHLDGGLRAWEQAGRPVEHP